MMVLRPIAGSDLPALIELAMAAGVGMTSLPVDRDTLAARIAASEATFAGRADRRNELWMFALADGARPGRLAGVCGIIGAVGLVDPWYTYRVGTVVHASRELGIFTQTPTLFLSNDHTGASELCSLLLHPDFRRDGLGSVLSKSRFLFMAEHASRFADVVIAELRGVTDEQGRSPFWESLGRHFFAMDFAQADTLTGMGHKSFVAELMPKHPLYCSFLTPEAQAVIGVTHPLTAPARRLLESEGFRYDRHVDIFDAGPTLECALTDIGAVRASRVSEVARIVARDDPALAGAPRTLIANTGLADFRLACGPAKSQGDGLAIAEDVARALHLAIGARVRHVVLSPAERSGTS
jgi:arginine N-succinyltransferase